MENNVRSNVIENCHKLDQQIEPLLKCQLFCYKVSMIVLAITIFLYKLGEGQHHFIDWS